MPENESQTLPKFASLTELVDFLDTNDLGDYLDQMPEARFEVTLKKSTRMIPVDEEVARKLSVVAHQEHLPLETLTNQWLLERLASYPA